MAAGAGAGALRLLKPGELLLLSDMPDTETIPYHALVVGETYTKELLYNTQSIETETAPHNVEVRVSLITITKIGGGGAMRVEYNEHNTLRKLKISTASTWEKPYFETEDFIGSWRIYSYHPHLGKTGAEDSSDEDAKPKQEQSYQRIFPAEYFYAIKSKMGGGKRKVRKVRKTRGRRTRRKRA